MTSAGSTATARRALLPALALALLATALGGCETTAEKSAKLKREAKHVTLNQKGLSIAHASTDVTVLRASVVRNSEGAAAVVTLRNHSARALRAVPIAITVKDASGRTLFQNNGAGLEGALVAAPSIAAHSTITWVDDQLPAGGAPASVSARVGEAPALSGAPPKLVVEGAQISEDPANGLVATGRVENRSPIAQKGLVLFGVARRQSSVVAAGRGVVSELAAGASAPFQIPLIGGASGAHAAVEAPAATFAE